MFWNSLDVFVKTNSETETLFLSLRQLETKTLVSRTTSPKVPVTHFMVQNAHEPAVYADKKAEKQTALASITVAL